MKYGKLRTKDEHIISSKWISKDKTKSRNNYSVVISNFFKFYILKIYTNSNLYQINITIDRHAHRANVFCKLISEEIFGEVEYFITHKYNELERMFTYVRKINKYEDNYGQIYFNNFSSYQFIEVIGID